TTLITRKDSSGPVTSLAVLEGLVGLPLEREQFKNTTVVPYQSQEEVIQAVLDGETDAAFMRTHAAQFFINNDGTNSLGLNTIDADQIAFYMFVPNVSDHELITILNKCIQKLPDDVLSQLIIEYTAMAPENVTFVQYLAAHPGMILLLSGLAALAIGVIIFFYQRSKWNNKLLQAMEQSKQELEEQLAIVKALSRDYLNVYALNMRTSTLRVIKLDGYQAPGTDWKGREALPYAEVLGQYIDNRVLEADKSYMREAVSLPRVQVALAVSPEYTGTYRVQTGEEIHDYQFTYIAYQSEGRTNPIVLVGFRNIDEIVRKEQKQKAALEDALHMAQAASEAKTSFLSNMSHDIRTPMNAIIGFLTLMRDEVDNPDMVREYIQRIDTASQHLLGLINDVLDMNKIESGSTTLSLAEMNLAEVIAEINSIIQPQAKAKNQTFEISASHLNFEHLVGDKMRINQILI
ncbi:MAG: transporter substrate-binding domain-containing protein, partial [Oscillospiraceae bacterium]|nr:transporter substrate-binding domain-containing protein [Oscillospiraceae bacterium]